MIGSSVRAGRGAIVQMAAVLTGAAALVAGFALRRHEAVAVGAVVATLGVVVFVVSTVRVARTARRWSPSAAGVLAACVYFALAALWGWLMSENLMHGFAAGLRGYAGVGVHAALGLGGWFAQLIVAVSYHLLPRFVRAASDAPGRVVPVLILINASVVAFVAAAATASGTTARVGAVLAAAAAIVYAVDLQRILRGRRRPQPDLTVTHWWVIVADAWAMAALGGLWAFGVAPAGHRVAAAAAVLMLLGWVTLAIMGQLYKVTPFLIWHYRLARRLAAEDVSRLPAPYRPRGGIPPLILTAAGGSGLALAVLTGHSALGVASGLSFLLGTIGYWWLMAASWMRGASRT
jgi:hypothetical protein